MDLKKTSRKVGWSGFCIFENRHNCILLFRISPCIVFFSQRTCIISELNETRDAARSTFTLPAVIVQNIWVKLWTQKFIHIITLSGECWDFISEYWPHLSVQEWCRHQFRVSALGILAPASKLVGHTRHQHRSFSYFQAH